MKWTIASKTDLESLTSFILEEEWNHTFFSTRLLENGKFKLPPKSKCPILLLKDNKHVKAACMVTIWGTLFPVFREYEIPGSKEMMELAKWLERNLRKVNSVMGIEERVQLLKKYIYQGNGVQIDYNLMVKKNDYMTPAFPGLSNLSIRKAGPDDSAALLNLEIEYQKEEVMLDPSTIDNTQIYHNLRGILDRQTFYYVTKGVIPIAKAGTNAIGHEWNQIGGVYTDKDFRKRGLSTWLMDHLLVELERSGKKTVLFVKENNKAAEKVYVKLGFEKIKNFNIVYYL